MDQPITFLFPSQSKECRQSVPQYDSTDDCYFMGTFAEIQFDPDEENIAFDVMIKSEELILHEAIDLVDKNNELRVKFQTSSLNNELKELRTVSKEIHVLFVPDVKTTCENVNLKIEELGVDMAKEILALGHNYSSLHSKVDIIVDVVTKVVE
ncbi:unnamed protein product [Lactuca saligna]|uniref:Uncharacterized protein n=1 Tax=Lactuca saligna TaxID=75948 RepID=A0AA35ZK88_LACSI|nr:unnamed protein product [Lactuca saligna]